MSSPTRQVPRIHGDSSLAFLRDGYHFGTTRFDRFRSDVFRAHLMLKPVTFVRGASATEFFYEGRRFSRDRALPKSVLHSLQDEGSVQTLEGAEHRHRKAMFLDVMGAESMQRLSDIFANQWARAGRGWRTRSSIVLQDELYEVLTRTACEWAGVPLAERDAAARAREIAAMIANAGTFAVPNWIARAGRLRTEAWARDRITASRELDSAPLTVLGAIAHHRSRDGSLLPVEVAAIELLNIIRPMVAVGRFIVFAAWLLEAFPVWKQRFAVGDETMLQPFAQEVRRFSPFFPVVGGRATGDLEWQGIPFAKGDWVMLDLYATNRDERLWQAPESFVPERFASAAPSRNALVPQGGGIASDGHRCPGEDPTIELIAEAVRLLTRSTDYTVPEQDWRVGLSRMPTQPRSGARLENVRVHA